MSFSCANEYKKFIYIYIHTHICTYITKNENNIQDNLKLNITKENECIF